MRQQACGAFLVLVAAGVTSGLGDDAPAPVKVTVAEVTRAMSIAPMDERSFLPVPPPAALIEPLQPKLIARAEAFEKEYQAKNPALFAQAQAAFDALRALPRQRRDSPEAVRLWETYDAWRRRLREAMLADAEYARLAEAFYRARDSVYERKELTFPVVTLTNGLLDVKVAPTLGMRLWYAVNLRDEADLSGLPAPDDWDKRTILANTPWTAGCVEPSFPSAEDGMHVLQPAGFRVVRGDDGSATVAMDMRFTHHQGRRELARWGRYSQRILSGWVTLRPGEARYSVTYRVDNPNPLRRSDRLWVNFLFHADVYDQRCVVFPAAQATDHAARGGLQAVYATDGTPRFGGRSAFAIGCPYDFAGAYSPDRVMNCLLVKDRDARGLRLSAPAGKGGPFQVSTGTSELFEHSGRFLDPYVPARQTVTCYAAGLIARADYANRDVAVATDRGVFRLTCPRPAAARVLDGEGKLLAAGPVGPGRRLKGSLGKRLVVELDGRRAADVTFPLPRGDAAAAFAEARTLGGKAKMELEELADNPGSTSAAGAIAAAKVILLTGKAADKELAQSLANTLYRLGRFDDALKLAGLIGPTPAADYLRGLVAWERGEKADFGRAGLDAHYHRAMAAIAAGDRPGAIRLLDELLAARPKVYRPALCRAYLRKDLQSARALAEENPASPEAQLVLELLGEGPARPAREALVKGNPGAAEEVDAFRDEITKGIWKHRRRYERLLPGRVAEKP